MPIRITIEVDTEEQLDHVLANLKIEKGKIVAQTASDIATTIEKPEVLVNLLKEMKFHPKQLDLLKTLYENPDGVEDDELRKRLDLETGQALGGTLSGLTHQAKKFSLQGTDVVTGKGKKDADGVLRWYYMLTPQMMEVMKKTES